MKRSARFKRPARLKRPVTQSETIRDAVVVKRSTPSKIENKLLDEIAESSPAPLASMTLPSGRRVQAEATPQGERIRIESQSGDLELMITMTPDGPVLKCRAMDLDIAATGDMNLKCDKFKVTAQSGIEHNTHGDLKEVVLGDRESKVRGSSRSVASETSIESKRGDVHIEANDDVRLLAERIKLNC